MAGKEEGELTKAAAIAVGPTDLGDMEAGLVDTVVMRLLEFSVPYTNPREDKITITNVDYEVSFGKEQQVTVKGAMAKEIGIEGNQEAVLKIPVQVVLLRADDKVVQGVEGTSIDYGVTLALTIAIPYVGVYRFPVSFQGKINIPVPI